MKGPLVSCVIATKNRGHLIKSTLMSLQQQTYSNWECLIVQDWCEDWTNFVIETIADKKIRLYSNEGHGKSAAMNYAKQYVKGKYVFVFDDDDVMCPCKLEKCVQMMEETGADVGYSARYTHLLNNQITYTRTEPFDLIKFLDKPYIGFGSIVVTKELFNKVIWDEKLDASLDYDWISKIAMESPKMVYTDIPMYIWRNHLGSITYANNVLQRMNYMKVKRRIKRALKKEQPVITVEQWPKAEEL